MRASEAIRGVALVARHLFTSREKRASKWARGRWGQAILYGCCALLGATSVFASCRAGDFADESKQFIREGSPAELQR